MTTLVIAEHNNAGLIASTLNTVAAAKAIGGNIEVLVAGEGCQAAADAAAKIEGVSKVLLADNAAYAHQLPENMGLLIAEDDQLRLLLVDHGLEQLGHGQRVQLIGGLDQDGAVATQSQSGTQLLLGSGRADGYGDDFGRHALLFQAHGFFHGDFAEGVHRHLDVGEIDTGVVRFDANLDVVINDPFYRY